MLYDNTFYLGQIFQAFLHDTPEIMAHVRRILSSYDDGARTYGEISLSERLLAWLENQPLAMDAAHTAALLQIAYDFEAFANIAAVPQEPQQPGVATATF